MCMSAACILLRHFVNFVNAKAGRKYLDLSLSSLYCILASNSKDLLWFCRSRDSNQVQSWSFSIYPLCPRVLRTDLPLMPSPPLPVSAELFAPLFPLFLSAPKPVARSSPFRAQGTLQPNCLLPRTSAWCIFPERLDQIFNALCMSCILFLALASAFFCCNHKW